VRGAGEDGAVLTELHEDECWDLLRTRTVGRIGWQGSDGPTIVPVNYVLDERAVIIRTAPYTELGREGVTREVAFEVDDLDPVARAGWSVLVRGRRRLDPEAHGTTPRPEVWVGGSRWLVLRIEARTISGRRLIPSA
jgi:nitroimidazol reductase NimA-like FMN-containing flavoprotein (pyridoxamine 5'-phosphate oxidase superfamily)